MLRMTMTNTSTYLRGLFMMALLAFAPLAAADISGSWNFAVEIPGVGSGNARVTLQTGGEDGLSGTYSGQLGNTDISGSVDGDSFSFSVPGDMGTVIYRGQEQEDGTLEGTLDLAGMGEGSFVATPAD